MKDSDHPTPPQPAYDGMKKVWFYLNNKWIGRSRFAEWRSWTAKEDMFAEGRALATNGAHVIVERSDGTLFDMHKTNLTKMSSESPAKAAKASATERRVEELLTWMEDV